MTVRNKNTFRYWSRRYNSQI